MLEFIGVIRNVIRVNKYGDLSNMPPPPLPVSIDSQLMNIRLASKSSLSTAAPSLHPLGPSGRRPHEAVTTFGRKSTKHLDRQSALLKAKPLLRTSGSEYVALPRSHASLPSSTSHVVDHRLSTLPPVPPPRNDSIALTSSTAATVTRIGGGDQRRDHVTGRPIAAPRRQHGLKMPRAVVTHMMERTLGATPTAPNEGTVDVVGDENSLNLERELTDKCYEVRYVGRLDVNTSMKILDFETRSLVAKECINRICEAAGLKTPDRKRKVDKKVSRMLGDRPAMEHAGADVHLYVSSNCLQLKHMESNEVIATHDMPNISFASGGDADTLDFVAYVAKDDAGNRGCYVLECGRIWASSVINTIGLAFELRFKEYLRNSTSASSANTNITTSDNISLGVTNTTPACTSVDPEYYNDLPGKVPPEMAAAMTCSTHQVASTTSMAPHYITNHRPHAKNDFPASASLSNHGLISSLSKDLSPNLIDLNSELAFPMFSKKSCPEYANDAVCNTNMATLPLGGATLLDTYSPRELSMPNDPFDMQPFGTSLLPGSSSNHVSSLRLKEPNPAIIMNLDKEDWFHGPISRRDAELLLLRDGEFLVRESLGSPGQYVLTGMQGGTKKHLLLVDPEGVVRTKDKTFENVSHLVNYHRNNGLPIISAESALILRHPVPKRN